MATLTVDSLSITASLSVPLESGSAILAVPKTRDDGGLAMVEDGFTLPSSSTSGTWSGTPTVQTDFSP